MGIIITSSLSDHPDLLPLGRGQVCLAGVSHLQLPARRHHPGLGHGERVPDVQHLQQQRVHHHLSVCQLCARANLK